MPTITILLLLTDRGRSQHFAGRGHKLRFDDYKAVTIFSEGYDVELHQPQVHFRSTSVTITSIGELP